MLKKWNNFDTGGQAKKVIEENFQVLGRHLSDNVLTLSSDERQRLSSEYYKKGTVVFDTTLKAWLEYTGTSWENLKAGYVGVFSKTDWGDDGTISIPFNLHKTVAPTVCAYMKLGDKYILVYGLEEIDENDNITLSTDLVFEGKVVVK